nr:hypothetical protein CFP56_54926 [Quercus suber]
MNTSGSLARSVKAYCDGEALLGCLAACLTGNGHFYEQGPWTGSGLGGAFLPPVQCGRVEMVRADAVFEQQDLSSLVRQVSRGGSSVLSEKLLQPLIQELHILLAVPRPAGPVAPDAREDLERADAASHAGHFDLGILRSFNRGRRRSVSVGTRYFVDFGRKETHGSISRSCSA